MKIRTKITVDLLTPAAPPHIFAKQGDSNREVAVTLRAGGDYPIPSVAPQVYIKKPDGEVVYDQCTLENGEIIVPLQLQSVVVPGKAGAELLFVEDGTLSTPVFILEILPSNVDEAAIESTSEFSALVEALQEIQGVVTMDTAVSYVAPSTYTQPASGMTLAEWLGNADVGLLNLFANMGMLKDLATTDKTSLVAAINELKAGKIDTTKILSNAEWLAPVNQRGFVVDAADLQEFRSQVNSTTDADLLGVEFITTPGAAIVRKWGKLVMINLYISMSVTASGTIVADGIPADFCPREVTYLLARPTQAANAGISMSANISTVGRITCNASSNFTGYVSISGCYIQKG